MRIDGNFPVVSQAGSSSRNTLPATAVTNDVKSSGSVALSSIEQFESASAQYSERFFKVEGLSNQAKEALSAYQATESLSFSNPRNLLIGVDVYA